MVAQYLLSVRDDTSSESSVSTPELYSLVGGSIHIDKKIYKLYLKRRVYMSKLANYKIGEIYGLSKMGS